MTPRDSSAKRIRTRAAEGPGAAVLVVGLGRFGSATARGLLKLGREVMAVERRPELVQEFAGELTHVVEADSTSVEALRQAGAADFSTAVVGIGSSVEASVLTTANLIDLGVEQIWAKAISRAHGRILERIGATHVLYPETEAGERVAHLVSSRMLDYMEFDGGRFAVMKVSAPRSFRGQAVADVAVRCGVSVVGVKVPGASFAYAAPDTVIGNQDVLIVAGDVARLDAFAARP